MISGPVNLRMTLSFLFVVAAYFAAETAFGADTRTCKQPKVANGEIWGEEKSTYTYREIVKIRCWDRYRLLGKDVIKCRRDGTWSENSPYCQEITCPVLFTVLNGTISPNITRAKIGARLNISCDEYHVLIGSEHLRCNKDGIWEPNRMPYCKEVRCRDFPGIEHGETHPTTPLRPGTVFITCEKGYQREGPEKLSCGEDGKWSPNIMPYCITECEADDALIAISVCVPVGIIAIFGIAIGLLWKKGWIKWTRGHQYIRADQIPIDNQQQGGIQLEDLAAN